MKAIWIADDDYDDVLFYRHALSVLNSNAVIMEFSGGKEVLEKLQSGITAKDYPLLLIMDEHMPQMNGIQVLENLKNLQLLNSFPIVLMTGILSPKQYSITQEYKVPVFEKPTTSSDLVNLLAPFVSAL